MITNQEMHRWATNRSPSSLACASRSPGPRGVSSGRFGVGTADGRSSRLRGLPFQDSRASRSRPHRRFMRPRAYRALPVTSTRAECSPGPSSASTRSFGMWVPLLNPSATDATIVQDSYCLDCHSEVLEATLDVRVCASLTPTAPLDVGVSTATRRSAMRRPRRGPESPSMNDCTSCHVAENASIECEICHTGRSTTIRIAKPEFGVTHGPTWRQTHGMGQMSSCSVCHAEDSCSRLSWPGGSARIRFPARSRGDLNAGRGASA